MEVQNPIFIIRSQQGLSLRRTADAITCHYQALYMVEHGMYVNVLPKILDWAIEVSDRTRQQIEYDYMIFRSIKQDEAREIYSLDSLDINSLGTPGKNPVRKFRDYLGLTQSAFCKDLCIPVALLYTAEQKSVSLPKTLKKIFQDLGIPNLVIQEMIDRYELVDQYDCF